MKNVRNIFILYLAGLLLLSGCGKETTTETAAAVNTAPAETIPETTADPLPTDLDFGGETVSMYVRGDTLDTEFAAEATGDVVNDALYQRNFNIEERYNAKLSIFANTSVDYWGERNIYMDTVRSSVMANDGSIDIVAGLSNIMPTMAKEGLFTNLTAADMPYLHFSADWWSKTLVDELAIDGRLYFASGEAGLGVIRGLMCMFYNKDIITEHGLPEPYTLVEEGTWTTDKMEEMALSVYEDVNGDGTVDNGDRLGFILANENHAPNFLTAGAIAFTKVEEDGSRGFTLDSEKSVSYIQKMAVMMAQTGFKTVTDGSTTYVNSFQNGLALFTSGEFYYAETYRDLDFDYGILPFPKFDENQQDYITTARSTFSMFAIPKSGKRDQAAAVLEAYAYEGRTIVTPAYYETALKVKYSRDDVSARMFDIIRDGITFDFGITCGPSFADTSVNIVVEVRKHIGYSLDTWVSSYAAVEQALAASLADYVTAIQALAE